MKKGLRCTCQAQQSLQQLTEGGGALLSAMFVQMLLLLFLLMSGDDPTRPVVEDRRAHSCVGRTHTVMNLHVRRESSPYCKVSLFNVST